MGKNKRHSIRQTDIRNFNILLVTSLLEKQNLFLQRQMYHYIQFYFITDIHYGVAWGGTRLKRKGGNRKSKVREGKKLETGFLLKSAPDFWRGVMSKCKEGSPCVYFRL